MPWGNRYVVVATDYFTKGPEAAAIRVQEATKECKALIEEMFIRPGVPNKLHSDQGQNFEAQLVIEIIFSAICL